MQIVKYTKIVIQSQPDAFLVKCGYCNGSGGGHSRCSCCDGAGKVLLRIPDEWDRGNDIDVLKCAYCNGSGGGHSRCSACHGVGAMVKYFPRVECSYCNGSGGGHSKCSSCHGSGSVWVGTLKQY